MADGSAIEVPPKVLYSNLRTVIFGGRSVTELFRQAFYLFGLTVLVLLSVGLVLDRTHEAESRNGRRIRGPRIVSRWRFNLESMGDGLRFPLTSEPNLWERLRGKAGSDLVLRRSKEAQHIQVSGDTGAGKSTIIRTVLYQVEARGETAIVFDPEREYLKEFYRESRGDIVLNPKDKRCPYWAIGEEADDEPQATPIANGLFPEEPTQQKFFLNHTRAIFAYLLAYYKPTVNELGHWMAHPEEIDKRVKGTEHAHTMTENAAPQRAGILGTLNEAGKPLRMMPTHQEGRKKFTIREWARKRKGWIFVTSTSETIDALRPLQGLWLDMLILKLQADDVDDDANRCWLVLDEVQELQRLPQLPKALTRQRKSDNPIVVGFQGMAQIDANYGKQAETMLSQPFYNFILRSQESRASKHLSDRIGSVQLERVKESKPVSFLHRRYRSYSTERVIEPLVLPSEIQELEDLTGYFVASGKVVKIAFDVPPKRLLAPGLIERMIPNVQTRPLDPEVAVPGKPDVPKPATDKSSALTTAAAFD
ncbi:MAG: type IV secretion system DNA-binding domain-containing protein [Acidobacteriaceae bacterium]|nr:type IV secretion system DNA-binding domain-containing protein [Acidobacteriaceae bacterium]